MNIIVSIIHFAALIAFVIFLNFAIGISEEAFWYAVGSGFSCAIFAYSGLFPMFIEQ